MQKANISKCIKIQYEFKGEYLLSQIKDDEVNNISLYI